MDRKPRVLAFAGSAREESWNKRLVRIAAEGARQGGAEVDCIDLRDYRMPLFDEELEAAQGKPEAAKKLKRLMIDSDGLLIASPEYNSSITGLLKNTIDWVSRPDEGEEGFALAAFRGKVVTLMSASPGGLGGLRGLVHVRAILGSLGCIVLPDQFALSKAYQAFNEDGTLSDSKQQERVLGLGKTLAETTARWTA